MTINSFSFHGSLFAVSVHHVCLVCRWKGFVFFIGLFEFKRPFPILVIVRGPIQV
jgi:hypothetical protein